MKSPKSAKEFQIQHISQDIQGLGLGFESHWKFIKLGADINLDPLGRVSAFVAILGKIPKKYCFFRNS